MARIKYITNSPFGSPFNALVYQLVFQLPQIKRIKKIADDITNNGANPAALEASSEFGVAAGQGAAFYAAVQDLNMGLQSINSLPFLDPGN